MAEISVSEVARCTCAVSQGCNRAFCVSGTRVGDPEELTAIDEILCQDRKDPLLICGVKSNMGHSEAASGICSVIKVIIDSIMFI